VFMSPTLLDELTKIGISLLIGSILGLEREYQNKPAGFRTIALICVGATLFTIISIRLGEPTHSMDRIAANIITGIGFIGAGVIFKNGANVYGLTTAATIWIAAGIGMSVGTGDYILSFIALAVTLIILMIFEYFQEKFFHIHQRRLYFISFNGHELDSVIEKELKKRRLKFFKHKEKRNKQETTCEFEVIGSKKRLDFFNEFLLQNEEVKSFEY
jgi:putative Mg2+ transporter-C (MgtC) family protein